MGYNSAGMKKTELEIRRDLIERAERLFGKARADELRADIEQLSADVFELVSFEVGTDDEP